MSKTLHITVVDKIATYRQRDGVIVCGNNDYVIEFTFDAEWDEHTVKTARFITNGTYTDVVFEGTSVAIPVITNTASVSVGVFAGDLRTTTPAVIECQKSILCDGGIPAEPPPEFYGQIMAIIKNGGAVPHSKISEISLPASGWVGTESPYSQVVTLADVTENTQVDLTPSVEQLSIFHHKDLAFVTENEGGVVTVYAIGDKPANDYTIQVTMTEVVV